METLALYRKYRSLTFDTVVGQDHITSALKTQVASGRISHAYIFTGTRGTGKTSCAKILARAVNCQAPVNGNPCNTCPACLSALNESAMDIVEIDAASNNGVDNIRQLRDECQYSPSALKMRVYIIDEVHMLSAGAFNAMLKMLEEPPAHALFILATTEIHKVPITILSRCQRYDFHRIPHDIICQQLSKIAYQEGFSIADDAVSLVAKLGDGSMRDAISLLDRCRSAGEKITYDLAISALSIPENHQIYAIWQAICTQDVASALHQFDVAYTQGRDILSLFDNLLSLIRDIYIYKSVKNTANIPFSSSFTPKEIQELAQLCTTENLDYFIQVTNDTLSRLTRTSIRRMDGEVCLIKLCSKPTVKVLAITETAEDLPPFTVPKKQSSPPAAVQKVVAQKAPTQTDVEDDAPPFAVPTPPTPVDTPARPAMPSATAPSKTDDSDPVFKAQFVSTVGATVNVGIRQMLTRTDIFVTGSMVVVVCDDACLEFLQRTSVTAAFHKAAIAIGMTSAKVTSKHPGKVEPKKADTGIDELIEKAQQFGFSNRE